MGDRKREERRERAEQARQLAERLSARRKLRSGLMVVVGVLAALAIGILATRRSNDGGRVWSAEHGHWHNR